MPKIAYRIPDIKGKPEQSSGLVAKTTKNKVVSKVTSKHICSICIVKISEEY